MSQLDQIININILLQTNAVPQPSFSIPLILGSSNHFAELIRYYSDPKDMLADGYLSSDLEYKHGVSISSQALRPVQWGVGRRTAAVIQIVTVTPDVSLQAVQHFIQTINGTAYDFTSDSNPTAAEVVAGLTALINADGPQPVTASGSTTLILTADVAGQSFDHSESANLAAVTTQANHGVVEDISAVQAQSDLWYGVDITSNQDYDILQLAAWIETQVKIFVGSSNDAAIPTAATTDLMSILKGKGYNRTALMFSLLGGNLSAGIAAAWLGGQLPAVPGSSTWKFKQMVGITPDTYNGTQRNYLIGVPGLPQKNANIYENVGGVPITEEGWMASGRFIDITVGMDWFKSVAQTNIYQLLVNNPKIPYTDQGGAVIQTGIMQAIKQGITNGLIDGASPYTVVVPPVLSLLQADRAARILSGVTFSFRLAGAFHFIKINGTVTV